MGIGCFLSTKRANHTSSIVPGDLGVVAGQLSLQSCASCCPVLMKLKLLFSSSVLKEAPVEPEGTRMPHAHQTSSRRGQSSAWAAQKWQRAWTHPCTLTQPWRNTPPQCQPTSRCASEYYDCCLMTCSSRPRICACCNNSIDG